jgi:hypothetical protein
MSSVSPISEENEFDQFNWEVQNLLHKGAVSDDKEDNKDDDDKNNVMAVERI